MIKGTVSIMWNPTVKSLGSETTEIIEVDENSGVIKRIEFHPHGIVIYSEHYKWIHPWHTIISVEVQEAYT